LLSLSFWFILQTWVGFWLHNCFFSLFAFVANIKKLHCEILSTICYIYIYIYIYIVTCMTCCFLFLSNIYQWKAASVWITICHLQFWVTVWFVVKDECQKRYVYGNSLLSCMMILIHFVAWSCDGGSDWQCILVMGNYKDRNLRWLQAEFHFSSEGLISSPDWGAFSWALARL